LALNIKSEQVKFEATIDKYRAEKKKLSKMCHHLEQDLKAKESELVRTKQAADQLKAAFSQFQNI
jgi:prefoldin subunit 5